MERLISCVLLAFPLRSVSVPFAFPKRSGNAFPVRLLLSGTVVTGPVTSGSKFLLVQKHFALVQD